MRLTMLHYIGVGTSVSYEYAESRFLSIFTPFLNKSYQNAV